MATVVAPKGWSQIRRVFPHWSITFPVSFEETFVEEDGYWHAWDENRSISLTSMAIADRRGRQATREELLETMLPPLSGTPLDDRPPGLSGVAAYGPIEQPARASSALTGVLPVDGRILLATITSDDFEWARETWVSIRHHPGPGSPPTVRPRAKGRRR